jgi:hypothetical protein
MMIFLYEIFFKIYEIFFKIKKPWDTRSWESKNRLLITNDEIILF